MVRAQITFREWLSIVGIVFIIGAGFLLLEQVPLVSNFLGKVGDYIQIQNEHIY